MKVGVAQIPRGTCRNAHGLVADSLQAMHMGLVCLCEDDTGIGHDGANAGCVKSHLIPKEELAAFVVEGWRRPMTKRSRRVFTCPLYDSFLSNMTPRYLVVVSQGISSRMKSQLFYLANVLNL